MSMWIPNTDMGKGETYVVMCYEKLDYPTLLDGEAGWERKWESLGLSRKLVRSCRLGFGFFSSGFSP